MKYDLRGGHTSTIYHFAVSGRPCLFILFWFGLYLLSVRQRVEIPPAVVVVFYKQMPETGDF